MNSQTRLPKGFLSRKGVPTMNAVTMYVIYLSWLPKGWNINILNKEALSMVRSHFKVNYGFGAMIMWGILHGCCMSKTSSDRHTSMSTAFVLAKGLVGANVIPSTVSTAA